MNQEGEIKKEDEVALPDVASPEPMETMEPQEYVVKPSMPVEVTAAPQQAPVPQQEQSADAVKDTNTPSYNPVVGETEESFSAPPSQSPVNLSAEPFDKTTEKDSKPQAASAESPAANEPMEIDETPSSQPAEALDVVKAEVPLAEASHLIRADLQITKPTPDLAARKPEEASKKTDSDIVSKKPKPPVKKHDAPKQKPPAKDLTLGEVFEIVTSQKSRPKKRNPKKIIKVSLLTTTVESVTPPQPVTPRLADCPRTFTSADRMLDLGGEIRGLYSPDEAYDGLAFFEETHEDQDPAYAQYIEKKKKADLGKELQALSDRDKAGQKEIEDLISRLAKEKRDSTDKSHHNYRQKVSEDEQKEHAILQNRFRERSTAEELKMQKGLKYLQAKQQKEVNMAMHQHQQRHMPENQSQAAWQKTTMQLQVKHQRQIQDFQRRSEEWRNKTKADFAVEREKIVKKYAKKKDEVDARRDKFVSGQLTQFTQLKQRYLRRHFHKFMTEKEALIAKTAETKSEGDLDPQGMKSAKKSESTSERKEHQPPPPIRSVPDWVRDPNNENSDSIKRQKHRKGVMSQAARHVSIEIHNEGIWTLFVHKADEEGKSDIVEKEFIQWGPQAFKTLEAVVSGEVPTFYSKLDLSDTPASQGGQLRCSITDLRTSSDTAMAHRAESYKLQENLELGRLEAASREVAKMAFEAEKAFKKAEAEEAQASEALESAAGEAERTKQELQKFKSKFSSFLGQDGNPLPTTSAQHRQELTQSIMQYKSQIAAAANKATRAHHLLTERKNRTQRLNLAFKAVQKDALTAVEALKHRKTKLLESLPLKNDLHQGRIMDYTMDHVDYMVAEVVASFSIVAEKRRESLNKKKSSSFSKIWADSFPELSEAMKKSLWHRMVRRKQQAILRPSRESMDTDLRAKVKEVVLAQPRGVSMLEEELQKAEQLFLLACFPAPDEPPLSIPTQNGQWAEPGSTINLCVPETSRPTILPCAPSFPVLNKALCDFASASGRQAAAVLNTSSFRPMMGPLTTLSKASSLAEDETVLFRAAPRVDGDPLDIPDDGMKKAYTFSLKIALARAQALRRKPPQKDDLADSHSTNRAPKSDSSVDSSSSSQRPQKRRRGSKDSEPSPRKKAESSTASNSNAAAAQASRSRKKTPAEQTLPQNQPVQLAMQHSPGEQRYSQAVDHRRQSQQRENLHHQRTPSTMQMQQQNLQQQQRSPSNIQMRYPSSQQEQQQQMAQFRMMHPQMASRPVPPGFPQNMQIQQFYAQMGHQGQRGPFQPGMSPMQMQRPGMSMPFPGMPMPGQSTPQHQGPPPHGSPSSPGTLQHQHRPPPSQGQQQQSRDAKEQSDQLFILNQMPKEN